MLLNETRTEQHRYRILFARKLKDSEIMFRLVVRGETAFEEQEEIYAEMRTMNY